MPAGIVPALIEDQILDRRPGAVLLAGWLLGASSLIAGMEVLAWAARGGGILPNLGTRMLLLGLVGSLVTLLYLQYSLLRGRIVAWVVALHLGLGLLAYPLSFLVIYARSTIDPSWLDVITSRLALQGLLSTLTLILLLHPASARWFGTAGRLRRSASLSLEEYVKSLPKCAAIAGFLAALPPSGIAAAEEPKFGSSAIFAPEKKHNHASCVVELPDGDLLATWYNGTGERRADDVVIQAARLKKGETAWGPRFLLADTPGYPDCNPALFAAPDRTLWLIYPTILDHRWEGALLKFHVATEYPDAENPPKWAREGVLHITPDSAGFEKAMADAMKKVGSLDVKIPDDVIQAAEQRSKDLLYQRLGWMPRVHAIVLPSGRWLWPLYCDTFSASIIAISDDQGATWRASAPIIGFGAIQPSLVRKDDGTIVAYMRDNGPFRRIRVSSSKDDGATWSEVTSSDLPNPGAGIEAIRLASGKWAMLYNDTERGRHSLALSLSDDEGATWKWKRHVALGPAGGQSFHYPSIAQAADGTIHMTYTHGGLPEGSTIRHAWCNEAWALQPDTDGAPR